MSKIKITQTRSLIRTLPKQRATLEALGLRKINQSVEHTLNDQIKGMLRVVNHLVTVQES